MNMMVQKEGKKASTPLKEQVVVNVDKNAAVVEQEYQGSSCRTKVDIPTEDGAGTTPPNHPAPSPEPAAAAAAPAASSPLRGSRISNRNTMSNSIRLSLRTKLKRNIKLQKDHTSSGETSADQHSLLESILVIVGGQLLAFNSGFTNGACLSGFLLSSGRRQAVSAFTGAYTGSALLLADYTNGDGTVALDAFGFQICMILSFIGGACVAGVLTPQAVQYRLEPTYGPTFLLGGLVLLGASILAAAVDETQDNDNDNDATTTTASVAANFVFYLAAFSNGIQNGMSSLYSGNLIRSTHMTGLSTDIALFVGQLIRGNTTNNWKLVVFVALAVSYWTGGFVSFYATQHFTSRTLLFNASLFLAVGFMLVMFLMHEHSVSFWQACLGTWHWKRVLHQMSVHHLKQQASKRNENDNNASGGGYDESTTSDDENNIMSRRNRLLKLFTILDADSSGMITPDELLEGFRQAGIRLKMKDIRVMIQFADTDGNGLISEDEWRAMVDEITEK